MLPNNYNSRVGWFQAYWNYQRLMALENNLHFRSLNKGSMQCQMNYFPTTNPTSALLQRYFYCAARHDILVMSPGRAQSSPRYCLEIQITWNSWLEHPVQHSIHPQDSEWPMEWTREALPRQERRLFWIYPSIKACSTLKNDIYLVMFLFPYVKN